MILFFPKVLLDRLDALFIFLQDDLPTTTYVAFANDITILGPEPCTMFCRRCRKNVQTIVNVDQSAPPLAWVLGGLLCIFG